MTKLPFTVSARTARLIGRENVAHAEGAIIELVKNSYDADADFALVLINPANKSVIIYDNGTGMTESDIKNHWMTIGTDNKEKIFRSAKGRVKAGAKGIGRFALDRLGESCSIYTLPKDKKDGYKWTANWNDFEVSGGLIGNVFAQLENYPNLRFSEVLKNETRFTKALNALGKFSTKHGTLIKIDNVRDDWSEEFSQKIFRSLEILTPPDGQSKFSIYFFNEEFKSSFGKLENESFTDYDYKIVASYKKNVAKEIDVKFYRNEFDYNLIDPAVFERDEMKLFPFDKRTFKKEEFILSTTIYELIPGFKEKDKKKIADTIGDFVFTFYFFKLGNSAEDMDKYKTRSFNLAVRRNWAGKFGGIKLFRDNFRVRPYGEVDTASYDWLMLGERKAGSPSGYSRSGAFRVSPYQVAGTVNFSRVSKLFLDDKSGREGLIENDTFSLFKNILIGIIRLQEDDRSTIASNLLDYYNEVNSEELSELQALEIANNEESNEEGAEAQNQKLKKGIKAQKNKIDEKDEELVMSRAMASAGILIASFSHEFHYIKNRLNNRSTNLKNVLLELLPESKFKSVENRKNPYHLLAELKKLDEKIKQWIEFSISLTRKDRRRSKKQNLLDYFDDFKKTWKKNLDDRGIALNISFAGNRQKDFNVKMIELDIDTIFDNLLANSIEAFQRDGFRGNRIININLTKEDEKSIDIEYRDSGPGLSSEIKKPDEIFKAFVTTKRDTTGNEIGTGLGMWLLKSSIDYNKGSAKLYSPDKGFQIRIKLKRFS